MELLADPPAKPDVSRGYLDLLKELPRHDVRPAKEHGSDTGCVGLGDRVDALRQRPGHRAPVCEWVAATRSTGSSIPSWWRRPRRRKRPRQRHRGTGSRCGSERARARCGRLRTYVDPRGQCRSGAERRFLRADAQQLPLLDETVDAAVSLAVLQLIPHPTATMSEMVRVLRPGGRLAVMVPTAGRASELFRWLPHGGVHFFAEDELADTLRGSRPRQRAHQDSRQHPVGARTATLTH